MIQPHRVAELVDQDGPPIVRQLPGVVEPLGIDGLLTAHGYDLLGKRDAVVSICINRDNIFVLAQGASLPKNQQAVVDGLVAGAAASHRRGNGWNSRRAAAGTVPFTNCARDLRTQLRGELRTQDQMLVALPDAADGAAVVVGAGLSMRRCRQAEPGTANAEDSCEPSCQIAAPAHRSSSANFSICRRSSQRGIGPASLRSSIWGVG